MERGRVLSLKRKIGLADGSKIREIVEELIAEEKQAPAEVIDALKERISKGIYIDSWTMGKLIVFSRDRDLYQIPHMKSMVLGNVEVLVDLLHAGIPDGAIEDRLCERLADDFDRNAYGFRQFVMEALRDYGSIKCLDTLEAIDFDFHGRFQTAKTFDDALGKQPGKAGESFSEWGERVIRGTDVMLGKLLKDAISSVRERNLSGEDSWNDEPKQSDSRFPQATGYIDLAHSHLSGDLGAALNNIRKATESLLKSVIKGQEIQPDKKEPIDEMQLPTLMAIVMDKRHKRNPEKYIYQYLEILQKQTTLGSHDQGTPIDNLVERSMVEGAIAMFNLVHKYFEKYVQEDGV